MKHTPGPWACDGISEYTGEVRVRCKAEGVNHGDTVARVCCYGPQSETPFAQKANARLIAAAPDLLVACIKTVEENGHLADGENCTLIHLVRAIAKATNAK